MANDILQLARQRGIKRLCHFTRLSSLKQIVTDDCIRASANLPIDLVNDPLRADGHQAFVCCSITYPNVFLLNEFAKNNIDDWCVLLLAPNLLKESGVRFCPVNAASKWGRMVQEGPAGFEALYQVKVVSGSRLFRRTSRQPKSVPTDNQAEVLVPGSVPLAHIFEVVLPSSAAGLRAEAVVSEWPAAKSPPRLRVESRMFQRHSYWDAGLFPDQVPIDEST